ncbi:MAG: amidase family protein [Myxococcota bacterium]|jgi:amidase
MSEEFAKADATTQAQWVRNGEVSPLELVDAAIARIEDHNPKLNAVIHPAFERARERATGSLPDGPFRGVPFLMKDLGGEEAGAPYHMGMRCLKEAGWTESVDSFYARRARAAGLVSLGRTNTPEIGLYPVTEPEAYGPTRNPWNLDHSPGGSSGGSSAAVAAGLVPAAHASDGGGSIRLPASMAGLVGLKPSRGRVSFGPGGGERWAGLSAQFCVTRSVRDAAGLLDVFAGYEVGDPYTAPAGPPSYAGVLGSDPGKLRVGLLPAATGDLETHPDCTLAAETAGRLLEGLGHTVELAHPAALDDRSYVIHFVNIVSIAAAHLLDVWSERLGRPLTEEDVEPLTWALAQRGGQQRAADYIGSVDGLHAFGRELAGWWHGGFDLLVTPSQAQPPPKIGFLRSTREDPLEGFTRSAPYGVFTMPFNMSGQPAISLPLTLGSENPPALPVGSQLVAAAGREDLLLQVSAQLEEAAPWAEKRPPIFG